MAVAYYYILAGGTADSAGTDNGRTTTKRTGAWSTTTTDYYDNQFDVTSGGKTTINPVAGDIFVFGDTHYEYTANQCNPPIKDTTFISVDVLNQDQYKKGAEISCSSNPLYLKHNLSAGGKTLYKGMVFTVPAGGVTACYQGADQHTEFNDCDFDYNTNLNLRPSGGTITELVNCRYGTNAVSHAIYTQGLVGAKYRIKNLQLLPTSTLCTGTLINQLGNNLDQEAVITDTDFTNQTSMTKLLDHGESNQDASVWRLERCLLPAGIDITNTPYIATTGRVELVACGYGDNDDDAYQRLQLAEALIDTERSIYRTAGAQDKHDVNFCMEAAGSSLCSNAKGVDIPLSIGVVDTADYTTSVTFTAHFAVDGSAVALNSDEVSFKLEHVDGLDNALGIVVSTKSYDFDVTAPSAPTTEASLWTGLGGTNKQMSISITVTIGTTAGAIASGVVRGWLHLSKASQTIFSCPQVEVS